MASSSHSSNPALGLRFAGPGRGTVEDAITRHCLSRQKESRACGRGCRSPTRSGDDGRLLYSTAEYDMTAGGDGWWGFRLRYVRTNTAQLLTRIHGSGGLGHYRGRAAKGRGLGCVFTGLEALAKQVLNARIFLGSTLCVHCNRPSTPLPIKRTYLVVAIHNQQTLPAISCSACLAAKSSETIKPISFKSRIATVLHGSDQAAREENEACESSLT